MKEGVCAASRPQFEAPEYWLRSMAEENTRTIVSRVGTGLLIADQPASDLPKALPAGVGALLGVTPPMVKKCTLRTNTPNLFNNMGVPQKVDAMRFVPLP